MRPESLYFLFSPVTRIKGVGGSTAKALERLLPPATMIAGSTIPVIRDLLFHLPVGIVDRRFTCPLHAAPEGVVATFVVTVDEHMPPPPKRGKTPYKVVCSNETGDITLVFFNAHADYIKQSLPVGSRRVISGRCEHFDYRLQMPHPDIIAPADKLAEVQKVEPVYPLTVGITSRRIAAIVNDALAQLPELPEWAASSDDKCQISNVKKESLPFDICHLTSLSWKKALSQAHRPQTPEDLSPGSIPRLRLAYDEILANQLYLGLLRRNMQQQAGMVIKGTGKLAEALMGSLPFALTGGQKQALAEIYGDMASGQRMGRLLQGDVGSGKTIVALLAMLRAAEQGLQAALMVPTEIIAQQHYEGISALLRGMEVKGQMANGKKGSLPFEICYLTSAVKGRQREEALAGIASGKAQIVIGTHALFQEHVEFKNLALVVIDEQHRFGVGQRMALSAKGNAPHLLHMTATPIPRSLAMTLYGDMECSQLLEKPAGRQPIATRVIPLSRYREIMERLKAALDKGEKAYWICPLIEDSAFSIQHSEENNTSLNAECRMLDADIAAAKSRFSEFKARFGPVVGLVHGRMKADERNMEMQKFAQGKTRLLVATTVVEVGVDVRDATIMVVEQAERFGLSQLHQLRGRVGRGDKPSACVLLYGETGNQGIRESGISILPESPSPRTPDFLSRLSILRETEDGFRIAEEDLRIRGGGDLLGYRQSGLPRFIFTDLFRHQELLRHARDEVRQSLAADPALLSPRGQALKLLLQLFGFDMEAYHSASLPSSSSGVSSLSTAGTA